MAWATAQQVEDITGTEVTAPELARAQAVVELYVNRSADADDAASVRDLYWLKAAVAWQAVWQKEQPGYDTRVAVTSMSQDGIGFDYASQAAIGLAPLAIRAIKNLSWFGNQSVQLSAPVLVASPAFNVEISDDQHLWEPLR